MRWLASLSAICAIWLCRVSAQANDSAPALSTCVTNCIFEFIPASGCGADAACLCDSTVYKNAVQKCLQSSCPAKEALLAGRYQSTACGEPVRSEDTTTPRVVWTMFATAAIGVVARLIFRNPYARGHGYGADDWTMLLALIFLIPFNAVVHLMAKAGTGRDIWSLEPENITMLLHTFWMEGILYAVLMTIIKVSILLLYLRIWTAGSTDNLTFRRVCFILIGVNIAAGIAIALSVVFECMPISYAWTRWDGEHQGTCIDYSAQSYAISAISVILDLVTFMLPIGKLANLPLSRGKKFGVSFVFALGLLATAASIVRLVYLIRDSTSPNFSLWLAPVATWTSLECNLAVICACLPAMAGLIQKVWNHTCKGKNWSTRRGSTNIDNVRLSSLHTPAQYYDEGGAYRYHSITLPEITKASLRQQISAEHVDSLRAGRPDKRGFRQNTNEIFLDDGAIEMAPRNSPYEQAFTSQQTSTFRQYGS